MTIPAASNVRPRLSRVLVWAIVAALLAVVALGGFIAWRWLHEQSERQDALQLAERGQFDLAEPRLREVIDRHPNDADVARALAQGFAHTHQPGPAETFLARWCELRPQDAEPFRRRIEFWMEQQKPQQALQDVEHVLDLEAGDEQLHRMRAKLLLLAGRDQEAQSEGERCLRVDPNDFETMYYLATAHERQGYLAEARRRADQLVQSLPNFPGGYLVRGRLELSDEAPAAAVPFLQKAAAMPGPLQIESLYQLNMALTRAGKEEEARKVRAELECKRAMELWSGSESRDANIELQSRVVDALLAAGKTEDAIQFLNGILQRNPGSAGTQRLLAACQEKKVQPHQAAEHRRRGGSAP